ncbi:MAG: hypothetical protein BCS36_10035 [Desulfovibrio sp. MES5]|uniref:hypothetical protein n=1 Tax=Desulfovibrio sp. MES5 TaxID=1899016 RepID=UPI000B9C9317|nr:hypothetical protein [Desulfovibrio sp. MES5]OXS28491.1 MAG: hypothetical protein BCS36_10035 [Desulfovibrio sp. MES5]
MFKSYLRTILMLVTAAFLVTGCSSYQPTKNVWKSTKGFWNTYVSPPASVDYDEKGELSPQALALTHSMMGIDVELNRLERVMLNADKPPTRDWISAFFTNFPWVSGFAGVKYDGTILGQEPANPMKQLDFIPLLYEDKKQSSRALRADVQPSPLGPEILLAAPLYDGVDFLGVVATYFDMRALMQYSSSSENVVILSPNALLWPGKYDFAATPLAGVNWEEVVTKSSSGTCTNVNGTFYYMVRYLGNLPLIFAVAEKGNFPEGSGSVEQGLAFFPKERPKLPPPPQPERKSKKLGPDAVAMPTPADAVNASGQPSAQTAGGASHDIQPGSGDSVLLKNKRSEKAKVQERQLEGENVPVERAQKPRREAAPQTRPGGLGAPEADIPRVVAPSPFGPREEQPRVVAPSPFGPRDNDESKGKADDVKPDDLTSGSTQNQPAEAAAKPEAQAEKAQPQKQESSAPAESAAPAKSEESSGAPAAPDVLPGGRPSPFGPRN